MKNQIDRAGGIQSFSLPGRRYVIFSVSNSVPHDVLNAKELHTQFEQAICLALGIHGKDEMVALGGMYEGKPETSFLVSLDDFNALRNAGGLATSLVMNEECVLILGPEMDSRSRQKARLVFPGFTLDDDTIVTPPGRFKTVDLGFMGEVTAGFAKGQKAYSARIMNGRYVYFVALHTFHWQVYEALEQSGNLARVQDKEDWYTARPVWLTESERDSLARYGIGEPVA